MKRALLMIGGLLALLLVNGCNTPWMTNTKRSAIEEYLIANAVERGISRADFSKYANKKVFLDYSNCDPQVDKPYIQGIMALHLGRAKVPLVKEEAEAEFIIEVLCGVLGTDHDKVLIGTPSLPIPVPDTGVSIIIPEIPLFMKFTRWGYSRFAFNILDAKRNPVDSVLPIDTKTSYTNWSILLVPFKTTDVPMNTEGFPTSFGF